MEAVDGIGGHADGGVETEREVGAVKVIVDGLGDADDVQAHFGELKGRLLGAVAADADEGVEAQLVIVLIDNLGLMAEIAVGGLLEGFFARGAEDGAASAEDAREGALGKEFHVAIQQAGEAVVDAYDFHAVVQEGRFAHAADGRVDTGAVAAG